MTKPAKSLNPAAGTSALEAEIDRHVYALYQPSPRLRPACALSPAEIEIVEKSSSPKTSVT